MKISTKEATFIKFKTDPMWLVNFVEYRGWLFFKLAIGYFIFER